MALYLDFDFDKVCVYEEGQFKFQESCLVLRDIFTKKIIGFSEEARQMLSTTPKVLAINFTENRIITSEIDMIEFIKYFIDKHGIKEFTIVDRYSASKNPKLKSFKFINENDFIKKQTNMKYYVDVRMSESIIFNNEKNILKIISKGKIKIQNYLNRYFYLNFGATLNSKKTSDLLNKLNNNEEIKTVVCRKYIDAKDIEVTIKSMKELLAEVSILNKEILSYVDNQKDLFKTHKYIEALDYVND